MHVRRSPILLRSAAMGSARGASCDRILSHNIVVKVTARTDIPRRTDIDAPVPYRQNKHVLFGQQEGRCNGCRSGFEFRHLEVDHIIP